jgi:hypothetical protein
MSRDKLTHMQSLRAALALAGLLLVLHLGGCSPTDREELRGSLYFAVGNYLALLDLRDGSSSIASNLGDVEILSLSPQLDERLLLTVVGTEGSREIRHLVLYDLASSQTLTLLNGRNGHYLPGTKVLVYDDGVNVNVTERIRGSWETTRVVRHRYNEGVTILPLSATRFLYRVGGGAVFVHDITDRTSVELVEFGARCAFDRALWFPEREQMLCRIGDDRASWRYAFVALDGAVGEPLAIPAERDLKPLVFLSDQGVLLLTERWRSALANRLRWGVWAYRFDTQESYRLLDDQYLGDSVFYLRD